MKYTFLLCALVACLLPGCFGSAQPSSTHNYLFKEGIINNSALQQVLAITNVPHNNTLESINKAVQGKREEKDYEGWLRKGERWETEDIYPHQREQLLPAFKELGYVDALYANHTNYKYALVLGSLVTNVRKRLAFLVQEWHRGVDFQEVILLGSARPLNKESENAEILTSDQSILPFRADWHFDGTLPTTEYKMMVFVINQANIPEQIRGRIKIFDTPMKQDGNRPNTQDTINTWLSTHPNPGTILAISHQPYIHYQHAVIRSVLPSEFTIETVGSAAKSDERMAMYLDSLAREIYQEYLDAQKR